MILSNIQGTYCVVQFFLYIHKHLMTLPYQITQNKNKIIANDEYQHIIILLKS